MPPANPESQFTTAELLEGPGEGHPLGPLLKVKTDHPQLAQDSPVHAVEQDSPPQPSAHQSNPTSTQETQLEKSSASVTTMKLKIKQMRKGLEQINQIQLMQTQILIYLNY